MSKKEAQDHDQDVLIPAAMRDKSKIGKYKPQNRGIKVPAGCTLQDLSTEQRERVMQGTESAWKKEYNAKKSTKRHQGTMSFDRG